MESAQNILLVIAALIIGFWYFGGFKLLRYFKLKKLKKTLTDPLDAESINSTHRAYAAGSPLPLTLSFTDYAVLKRLSVKDKWAKNAYEKNPHNPVSAYFYAGFLIAEMSELRGTSTVDKLSSTQISAIQSKLEEAEKIATGFSESRLNPADATAMLIDIYIHLGKSIEIDSLVKENTSHLEHRIDVVSRYLRALYPRWGGSHELLQQKAEEFSAQGGALLAAKTIAYCHLMEDQNDNVYKELVKKKPLDNWLKAYKQLPKTPVSINSYQDYNLLLAHKLFAKFFLYTDDKKNLKHAILYTGGHFSADEEINPHSKGKVTFYEMAVELGISSFS